MIEIANASRSLVRSGTAGVRGAPSNAAVALLAVLLFLVATPGECAAPQSVLFFTGSVQGYLDQCGCTRFPLGGLDKRSGYVSVVRKRWPGAPAILLDAGNFADTPGAAGDIKTRGLVRGMNKLGYLASGVGERELLGGNEGFQRLAKEAEFPFISTNLFLERAGTPWLAASAVLGGGGVRIGVMSITRQNPAVRIALPSGDTVVTIDPIVAVRNEFARLRSAADVIVVLAAVPIEDARLLARRVPGINLILGAHGAVVTSEPLAENGTQIIYAGDQGKYMGQVDVYRGSGRFALESRLAQLGDAVPSDAAMSNFVIEVLAKSQEAERQRRPVDGPIEARNGFVGSGACSACHPSIVAEWGKTDHARAWQTLIRKGPLQAGCIGCHVTGFGQPGGFVDASSTPHLVNVGCESCHGPGAPHIAQPERPYGKITLGTCTSCHTTEMDPTFNFYEDRQLIRHTAEQ